MSASISATSDAGRTGSQRAPRTSGTASRSGPIATISTPAASSARRCPGTACSVMPPDATALFFCEIPPNATISCVCSAITGQSVSPAVTSTPAPTTCGMITADAPKL
jgi:hypothetical protein